MKDLDNIAVYMLDKHKETKIKVNTGEVAANIYYPKLLLDMYYFIKDETVVTAALLTDIINRQIIPMKEIKLLVNNRVLNLALETANLGDASDLEFNNTFTYKSTYSILIRFLSQVLNASTIEDTTKRFSFLLSLIPLLKVIDKIKMTIDTISLVSIKQISSTVAKTIEEFLPSFRTLTIDEIKNIKSKFDSEINQH